MAILDEGKKILAGFVKSAQNWLNVSLKASVTGNRHFYPSRISLWLRENPELGFTFCPELFILAKNGELHCQENEGGNPATDVSIEEATRLAIIPTLDKELVLARIKTEYAYRMLKNKAFPTPVSKLRIEEYLHANLTTGIDSPYMLADEKFKDKPSLAAAFSVKDFTFTLDNDPEKTQALERWLHFLGLMAAHLFSAVAAAAFLPGVITGRLLATIGSALGSSPWIFGTGAAIHAGKMFGMYDMAEFYFREIRWFLSGHAMTGKKDILNTLTTSAKLMAIASIAFGAGAATFAEVTSLVGWQLPGFSALASMHVLGSISLMMVATSIFPTVVTTLVGSFLALAAAGGTFSGLAFVTRYVSGLSPNDNRISVQDMPVAMVKGIFEESKSSQYVDDFLKLSRRLAQEDPNVLGYYAKNRTFTTAMNNVRLVPTTTIVVNDDRAIESDAKMKKKN